MRATAAHGSVDQVGRVGWSGELGYGVRTAEPAQIDADHSARDGHAHDHDVAHDDDAHAGEHTPAHGEHVH
jgi:hypothetical protein